jgi:hypothetical protein
MNPNVFLKAAKLVDNVSSNFACNAIRRVLDDVETLAHPETEFFGVQFLDGKPDPHGEHFGSGQLPENREHRVMALLLCWAMTVKA